jgi:hypothetical protein
VVFVIISRRQRVNGANRWVCGRANFADGIASSLRLSTDLATRSTRRTCSVQSLRAWRLGGEMHATAPPRRCSDRMGRRDGYREEVERADRAHLTRTWTITRTAKTERIEVSGS